MKKLLALVPILFLFSCNDDHGTAFLNKDGLPIPTHVRVNDFTKKMLDAAETSKLEKELKDYEDSTSTQVVIMCFPSIPENGNGSTWDLEDFANKTFRQWQIGQKDKNNGILILVFLEDRKDRIEVGYGAEGALPDITCSDILEHDIKPNFKDEKYFKGLNETFNDIRLAMAGEYQNKMLEREKMDNFWLYLIGGLVICALVGFVNIWLGMILGALYAGIFWWYHFENSYFILVAIGGFIATFVINFILKSVGSDDGNYSSGSYSSSSGSSGFSGGGGSSGGGGASGGW